MTAKQTEKRMAAIQVLVDDARSKLEEAQQGLQDLVDARQEYFDERTERWQEGDAGSDYQSMTDDIDGLISGLDVDIPDIEL